MMKALILALVVGVACAQVSITRIICAMFHNVLECSRMFQMIAIDSLAGPTGATGMFQNIPGCSRTHPDNSTMF